MDLISLIAAILAFAIGIFAIVTAMNTKTKYNAFLKDIFNPFTLTTNQRYSFFESLMKDQKNTSMARGPQGPRGPVGPMGPPGGYYTASGNVMNMAAKMVATPTWGKQPLSIVYLDDKNYSPVQFWTLENQDDGSVKVRNKYTDFCLTTNNLGDVYSDICTKDDPTINSNQKFNWGKTLQLQSKSFANQCISTTDFTRTANEQNAYDYKTLEAKKDNEAGKTVKKLKLEACSASLNPKQTWYVGL